MSIFKRKYEFKPDRPRGAGLIHRLYITKRQRLAIARWLLMTLVLVVLSVVQDTILSRVRIFGATTDLVVCAILLATVMLDPEEGCLFSLISATLYWFSGSAPGAYVIALITCPGVLLSIFRHSYLRQGFSSTLLCTAVGMLFYELAVFAMGLFLGYTTTARMYLFCVTGGLSLVVVPVLYPLFSSIGKIGGESWKE